MARLVIIFIFVIFTGCYAQETAPQEDVRTWDFGKVKEGRVLKHEFIFKNNTGILLHVKNVDTSCGCTVSSVKKKVLAPGESTVIDVSFDSKGYNGAVEQFVYVNTDNLDNPIERFIIKAYVVYPK